MTQRKLKQIRKTTIIRTCSDCPFYIENAESKGGSLYDICCYKDDYLFEIRDADIAIPDQCKLEDYESA